MNTSTINAPKFENMPTDYTGLCQLLIPRPIHDEVEYQNVVEIMNVLAIADESRLNKDQGDYLDILSDMVERYDQENVEPTPRLSPRQIIKTHLDNIDMSIAEWGRLIGIDRAQASRLLSGNRKLSVTHLQKTSEALHLPKGLFI